MKIEGDSDNLIIYIRKNKQQEELFDDKELLEEYFRNLIYRLKDYYDLDISGFYDIDVYVDPFYGCVLNLLREDFDYYLSYSQIEMKIQVHQTKFLYQIEDYHDFNLDLFNIYQNNGFYYLEQKKELTEEIQWNLYENSIIKYKKTDKIINHSYNKIEV